MTIKFASGVVQDGSNDISYSNKNVHAQIVAFNADTKTDGTKAPFTFVTEEIAGQIAQYSSIAWQSGGYLRDFLQSNRATILSSDLNDVVCQVTKKTAGETTWEGSKTIYETSDWLFIPSDSEVGHYSYLEKEFPSSKYSYFSSASRLIKKHNELAQKWITRTTIGRNSTISWDVVDENGKEGTSVAKNEMNYFPLGFCI